MEYIRYVTDVYTIYIYISRNFPDSHQIPKSFQSSLSRIPHLHRRNLGVSKHPTGVAKLTRQKRFEKPRDFLVRKHFEKIIVPNLYFFIYFFLDWKSS